MFESISLDKVAYVVGFMSAILVIKRAIGFASMLLRTYFLTWLGITKTLTDYGEWAVVTGASDGIGKEYALQLASRGLNIVLISRTKAKLEKIAEDIKSQHGVDTRVIVFDFVQQYGYEKIEEQLKDLDIGVLINNVGMVYPDHIYFHNSDIEVVADMINTNMISLLKMTQIVVKGMITRKRGAIVHVSSATTYLPGPFFTAYSATKLFVWKFVKLLQIEDSEFIDHQILTPGEVASKMSRGRASIVKPTPERFVRSAIRTIGMAESTCGYVVHEIVIALMQWIPPVLLVPAIVQAHKETFERS